MRAYYYCQKARAYVGADDGTYFAEDDLLGLGEAVGEVVGEGLGLLQVGQVVHRQLDGEVAGALDGDVG